MDCNNSSINVSSVVPNCSLDVHEIINPSISDVTLECLNNEEVRRRTVPLIFLSLLVILGVPGNIMIMFIYVTKFQRKATHRTFVNAIAVCDFLVCSVAIPFEIGQMIHEYTFYSEGLCKIGRLFTIIFPTASALNLVALSANRYHRICYPMRMQLTYGQALKCIGGITLTTLFITWPIAVFSGIKLHNLENNLTGFDCEYSQTFVNSSYPFAYNMFMLAFFILCMTSLMIMCFLIGRQIIKHMEFRDQFRLSKMFSSSKKSTSSSMASMKKDENKPEDAKQKGNDAHEQTVDTTDISVHTHAETKKEARPNSPMKVTRTALVVSICFIIVFIPYVVIKIGSAATGGNIMERSQLSSIILPIFARTHYINSVVNFYIYLCLDISFRKHCKETLTSRVRQFIQSLKRRFVR